MLKVRSPMVSSVLDTRQAAGHLAPRARVQAQLSALAKNSFKRKGSEPDHVPNVFPTPLRRAKRRASLSKLTWPRSCPAIPHGHEPTGETTIQTDSVPFTCRVGMTLVRWGKQISSFGIASERERF